MPVSGGGSHYSWDHLYGYGKYGEGETWDSMEEDEAYVRQHLFTLPKSSGDHGPHFEWRLKKSEGWIKMEIRFNLAKNYWVESATMERRRAPKTSFYGYEKYDG